MFPRMKTIVCLWALCLPSVARVTHAQFDSLASRVPSDANCIVVMDIEKIMASPAAAREGWKKNAEAAYASGMTLIPPAASHAVFASQIDLEYMTPVWQAVMLQLESAPTAGVVAKVTGGTRDRIGPYEAVRLPQDAFVVLYPDKVYGVMAPANRQAVGRWVSQVGDRTQPELSAYLTEAYQYANEDGTPIIVAMDFENALAENEIEERVKDGWDEAGLEGKADPATVAKVLTGLRGITLGVTLRDKPFGKIKIDFATDVTPLADVAKPLFLHVLAHRGLTIDDFEDWKYAVTANQVTLEGNFTSAGLRRVFSAFDRPPALTPPAAQGDAAEATAAAQQADPTQVMGQATQAYFKQVSELIKDLKHQKNRSGTYTSGSIAQWCSNYARKIDRLPILNVDPEMLNFGNGLAQTLTQASMVLKTGNASGTIAAMNVAPQYNFYSQSGIYGSYRWGYAEDARAEMGARSRVKRATRSQSMIAARQVLDTIEPALQEVRRKMTEKYQIEFDF